MRKLNVYAALCAIVVLAACSGAPPTQEASNTAPAPAATPVPVEQTPPPAAPPPPQATHPTAPPPSVPSTKPAPPKPTATAQAPPAPPKPQMVEIPAGTVLEMELVDPLSSKTNKVGDVFTAKVINPVEMGGKAVIPEGAIVQGTVTEAVSAKQMTGQALLTLQFDKVTLPGGESVPIQASLSEKGKKIGKRTAGIVGGSAAGGAVLGRIIGKDTKGAVLGAAIGAIAGTGVAASQKGQELKLPAGTGMAIEIQSPIQVPVPPERV